MPIENKTEREELLRLVREAVEKDSELRETYLIGDKFRFIRDRLKALQARIEESLTQIQKQEDDKADKILEDETLVYVYLYNAQGMTIQTWQKMLRPKVFYEYSINRPIYAEKSQIDSFIRGKANKAQHGYLTIAVKKDDILKPTDSDKTKDAIGGQLIRVREGALHPDRLFTFTQGGNEYVLNEEGEIIKKIS